MEAATGSRGSGVRVLATAVERKLDVVGRGDRRAESVVGVDGEEACGKEVALDLEPGTGECDEGSGPVDGVGVRVHDVEGVGGSLERPYATESKRQGYLSVESLERRQE
jgi:hypothetical protein